jgi:membrane protein DedA with SNARE-associated domain
MQITAATGGYTNKDRIKLIGMAPVAYIGMYILSFVEYTATLRGYKNLPKIYKSHKHGVGTSAWKHVERRGDAVV